MNAPALPKRTAILMIATAALITLVVVALARMAYGLILPAMQQSLNLSYRQAGNLGTATALGYVLLVLAAGWVAARRGGRFCVLLGLTLAATGFAGLSIASHYPILLGLMTLLGFATAFSFTPLVSVIGAWFPSQRGIALGLLNSGVGIGMLASGILIPYAIAITGPAGWRLIWAGFAGFALLVLLAAALFIRNPPSAASAMPGQAVDAPPIYRNTHVLTVGLIYWVIGATFIVQAIFMYSYALSAGVSALVAGRLAAMMGVLSIFAAPAWGWLSDRIGRPNALLLAMTLALTGTALPLSWPVLPAFALFYALSGLTTSGLFTSILAAATERVPPQQAPLAVSFVTVFFAVGQLMGPAAAGRLIEWSGGFAAAFAASCIVMLAGILLILRLRRLGRRPQAPVQEQTATAASHTA